MGLKGYAVDQLEGLLKKAWGMDFLNKEETIEYLFPFLVRRDNSGPVELGEVRNIAHGREIIFSATAIQPSRNFVWDYRPPGTESTLLRIGSVRTGNKVLETDFGYPRLLTDDFGGKHVFADFFSRDRRPVTDVDVAIAPWSHYFRKEYYMYVMYVAAKLCRIKKAVGADEFNNAVIAYPLFDTTFERDYLDLLGVADERIIDTRKKRVRFNRVLLGNNDTWVYPNPADVLELRSQLGPVLNRSSISKNSGKRIYIARSGRRRVLNERALIRMLERWDFEIYPDQQRSVAEQYAMYNGASFIIGPHGSSFTNIVWCQPGTTLLELFPPRYVYNYFQYLSAILGLNYLAYCNGPIAYDYRSKTINDDIEVSIPELERALDRKFNG